MSSDNFCFLTTRNGEESWRQIKRTKEINFSKELPRKSTLNASWWPHSSSIALGMYCRHPNHALTAQKCNPCPNTAHFCHFRERTSLSSCKDRACFQVSLRKIFLIENNAQRDPRTTVFQAFPSTLPWTGHELWVCRMWTEALQLQFSQGPSTGSSLSLRHQDATGLKLAIKK